MQLDKQYQSWESVGNTYTSNRGKLPFLLGEVGEDEEDLKAILTISIYSGENQTKETTGDSWNVNYSIE